MNIISEILRGIWLMEADSANGYFPMVHRLLTGEIQPQTFTGDAVKKDPSLTMAVASPKVRVVDPWDIIYAPREISEPSIYIMDINGPITKYDQFCGPAGMRRKGSWLKQADNHPKVFAHVLRIDSPGGEGYACRYFQSVITSLQKPVVAYVEGMAASAAYWIASACGFVAASSPMDQLGSIGTYITLADYSAWYQKEGIRLVEVYASKSVDKNRDYKEAIAGNVDRVQKLCDIFNEHFLEAVRLNRKDYLGEESQWGTGQMFFAPEAISLGLLDEIIPLDTLLESLYTEYKP